MKKAYITLSHGQMHYRHAGKGHPILFLHMSGSSSDEYEEVGNLMSESFQVYAPDFYGLGSSDIPSCPGQYFSVSEHMESIKEFCDSLEISSVTVAGNLVGANVACRLAAAYPALVKQLVLFQVCYHPDPDYYKNLRYGPGFAEIPLSDDGTHLLKMWERAAKYGEGAAVTDARVACLHRAGALGEALHWALCDDSTFCECLPQISCPVKVYGYDFMNVDTAGLAAALMPKGRFEVLEHATPYLSRVNPVFFARKVRGVIL